MKIFYSCFLFVIIQFHVSAQGTVVWSNDFSNSSDWTMTNTSSPAQDWMISSNANEIPFTGLSPAMFTSVGNGYGFINSNGAGTIAIQNADLTLSVPIDLASLSSYSNFTLKFEHSYRTLEDTREVRVSGDNGSTWETYVITTAGIAETNQSTGNPDIYSLNITDAVINGGVTSSQVLVQFHYEGNNSWFWAVDDIQIMETYQNDLRLDDISFGSIGAYGKSMPYYQIPLSQIQPIEFKGVVTNIGVLDQTNVLLNTDISGAGTFTGTSAIGFTSVLGATDTVTTIATYTPNINIGNYVMNYTITMDSVDSDLTNNTEISTFAVTNYIYARDNGVVDGTFSNGGEGYEVGNVFDIYTDEELQAFKVKVSNSSSGNPLIYGRIYMIDNSDSSKVFIDQSEDYNVTYAEINSSAEITLCFMGYIQLIANYSYLLTVGSYGDGGSIQDLVVVTAGKSKAETSYFFDEPSVTWNYIETTPWVRMDLGYDCFNGINENDNGNVSVSQNFPNPFKGNTTVNYTLTSTDEVMVEITDITGKVIEVMNEGVRTAGSHTFTINSGKLAAGTYYYSVSTSNGKITKAMNVTK